MVTPSPHELGSQPVPPLQGVPAHVARAWFKNQQLAEAVVPHGALRIALSAVAIVVGVLIGVGHSQPQPSTRQQAMVRAVAPVNVPVIPVRYVDSTVRFEL
jgi:hypothetical protein